VSSVHPYDLYASGLLVARIMDGVKSYPHRDALGSLRAVTDGAGTNIYTTHYKPFGLEYGTTPGTDPKLKFTAQWKDSNTGLYYLFRRFCDPEIGRFLSQDPVLGQLTVPQSLDRYPYTVNNPLRYVDPTGED
jgi:RHS repeat-associated protein